MADDKVHIHKLKWEFKASARKDVPRLQEVSESVSGDLLPRLIQKVVDRFPTESISVVIPHLTLDLGVLDPSDPEKDMEEKLSAQIEAALQKEFNALWNGSTPDTYSGREDESLHLAEVWKSFLRSGNFSWPAYEWTVQKPDAFFMSWSEQHPHRVKDILQMVSEDSRSAIRLLTLLKAETVRALLRLWRPAEAAAVEVWLSLFDLPEWGPVFQSSLHPNMVKFATLIQVLSSGTSFFHAELVSAWVNWFRRATGYSPETMLEALSRIEENFKDLFTPRSRHTEEIFSSTVARERMQAAWIAEIKRFRKNELPDISADNFPVENAADSAGIDGDSLPPSDRREKKADGKVLSTEEDQQRRQNESQDSEGPVSYILSNAGAVLLNPFIPHFFREINLLDEQSFISPQARWHAAWRLQEAITGQPEVREYELVLNKVLCGISLHEPVQWNVPADPLAEYDRDGMLLALKEYWQKMQGTSIEGIRSSFLNRRGKLLEEDTAYVLYVEKQAWDVLLGSLPFPISVIKFPWMLKPVMVQW